jgi:hypothetical protein
MSRGRSILLFSTGTIDDADAPQAPWAERGGVLARSIRTNNDLAAAVSKMHRAADKVDGWINPRVAARLHGPCLKTLAEIVAYATTKATAGSEHP